MANPEFKVPEQYVPGFAKIASLDESQMDALFDLLSSLEATWGQGSVMMAIAEGLDAFDEEAADDVVSAVLSLYYVRGKFDWRTDWLTDRISEALAEADAVPDIASDPARFRLRLRRLLSLDRTLGITAKAIDVALEHEHTYCQARVLTDIRPIFTRDLSEQPAGAVIVHSLRLRHHVADSVREFFIAMTQTELDELRNVLYRASDKAATLRELLSAAGIPELTREGDETDGAGN